MKCQDREGQRPETADNTGAPVDQGGYRRGPAPKALVGRANPSGSCSDARNQVFESRDEECEGG